MTFLIVTAITCILVMYLRPLWIYHLSSKKVTIRCIKKDGSQTSKVVRLPKGDPIWEVLKEIKDSRNVK